MGDNLGTFGDAAKTLSRNPLGIIALFIVLVYGMAALVLGVGSGLGMVERVLLVLFLVTFPLVVLIVFRELVIYHTGKLYSPAEIAEMKAAKAAIEVWKSQPPATTIMRDDTPRLDPNRIYNAARMAALVAEAVPGIPAILWVDDRPEGNVHQRRALEATGFAVETSLTTDDALARARGGRFVAIISNMGRPEGEQAGYDLLERLQENKITTPVIFYTGSGDPEHRAEARRRGAVDSTNNPAVLLEAIARIASA